MGVGVVFGVGVGAMSGVVVGKDKELDILTSDAPANCGGKNGRIVSTTPGSADKSWSPANEDVAEATMLVPSAVDVPVSDEAVVEKVFVLVAIPAEVVMRD